MIDGWLRRRIVWYLRRHKVRETHSRREGRCVRCGACCNACPFYASKKGYCRVYKHRPNICRAFPLTPEDVRDARTCGFTFRK
ncbi:MAG: YkgJ family cysteine cluster protein [Candidatus Altiarchaeota archaeon]